MRKILRLCSEARDMQSIRARWNESYRLFDAEVELNKASHLAMEMLAIGLFGQADLDRLAGSLRIVGGVFRVPEDEAVVFSKVVLERFKGLSGNPREVEIAEHLLPYVTATVAEAAVFLAAGGLVESNARAPRSHAQDDRLHRLDERMEMICYESCRSRPKAAAAEIYRRMGLMKKALRRLRKAEGLPVDVMAYEIADAEAAEA